MHKTKRSKVPATIKNDGYRSGFEAKVAADLEKRGVFFDYEPFNIPWVQTQKKRYRPDWLLLPNNIIIESKGYFKSVDRSKHRQIKSQYPDLDLRFLFQRASTKLSKTSTTTYAKWAEDHGFPWAEGVSIPQVWVDEPVKPLGLPLDVLVSLGLAEPDVR